jgi:hypothetical protein
MIHIKTFESYLSKDSYLIKNRKNDKYAAFRPIDILSFIGLNIEKYYNGDENDILYNPYHIDPIEFLREIFIGKEILFLSIKNDYSHPENSWIRGIVQDVNIYAYKDLYIQIKVDDKWNLIDNNNISNISDYDANTKPTHKELEIKKDGELFNL